MFGSKVERPKVNERFKEISACEGANAYHYVVKDMETGVLYYMAVMLPNGGVGMTPLLDSNGEVSIESVD